MKCQRPRLSVALRTFSSIANPFDTTDELLVTDIEVKRKHDAYLKSKDSVYSWEEIKAIVKDSVAQSELQAVENQLKSMRNVTKELVGSEFSTELIDAACLHVFKLFHSTEIVTNKQREELRKCYGITDSSLANRAAKVVRDVVAYLPEGTIKVLLSEKDNKFRTQKPFGSDIKYKGVAFSDVCDVDDDDLEWMRQPLKELDINFLDHDALKPKATEQVEEASCPLEVRYNRNWLKATMMQYFGFECQAMETILESTLTLLLSNKKDTELQNELFDLLGFDRFTLIELLLEKRHNIVAACSSHAKKLEEAVRNKELGPTYGRLFSIQSEDEKHTMKFLRKEEKRLQRYINKAANDDEEEGLDLDPQFLKAQRERFFIATMSAPLFSKKSAPVQEKYPNVYDSYLEATKSAAFVSGTKMSLPIGFDRINNNKYEEIRIPANEAPPANVGKKLKLIAELDEWGQSAFEGMKTLNRIQSIVFDTAYHTNENMLICAPTGAGKTNIAMLTIVREIKQHIENNGINKNAFKIVYIAPMKALAAEMTANFGKRLKSLGISVREYTGDMQLTKMEISQTQIIVTTPEKWDVVTRKGVGDVSLTQLVSLLIFDEVHLLHGNRGPVVEALVARTLRQVESTQRMIRIIGLSATLPNYTDVATFLRVNPYIGLYYFDTRFRPVPLGQTFVGVKAVNPLQQQNDMDAVCYEKCLDMVKKGHQIMVFVHTRNSTMKTAVALRELASNKGDSSYFQVENNPEYGAAEKMIMKARSQQLREIFPAGFATHHAGMLRQDRTLVEKLFRDGLIKVLVCTATLAWGVNLPAHAVIIKGTEIYDAQHGTFVDLGILDVLQIFGRAGRPQYDTSGHGTIITSHDKLNHYLSLLTCQYPIESQFTQNLADNLNAEIVLGTVTNVEEAIKWLSYTYLFVRMRKNPQVYGIKYETLKDDPLLLEHRKDLIIATARQLDRVNMIRFHGAAGFLHSTDLGRTASHFYIKYDTMELVKEKMVDIMDEALVLDLVSQSEEFNQLKVREDEMDELDMHVHSSCSLPVLGGKENTHGKVNILIQSHVSRHRFDSFSLISDQNYVTQNATRIMRALFEIALRRHWPIMAGRLLAMSKVLEHQMWEYESPLRQFHSIPYEVIDKIERKRLSIEQLRELDKREIGNMLHHPKMGAIVKHCVEAIPCIEMDATVQPITRGILRVRLEIMPKFVWDDRFHGNAAESFWIWIEDPETNYMHHSEYFLLTKKQVVKKEIQMLTFTIPLSEPAPTQYYIRAISDRWLGSEAMFALSFKHLILPQQHPPHTELLNLEPLPITALKDAKFEALYNFTHFNPIQTQVFHTLYHTDSNILIGAPTGSGKTIAAEIAFFRVFREYPQTKVVYIAPLKALVRERVLDWKVRLERRLGKKIVELTGDVLPDANAIANSDVIITTPEKWDGVSRSWQTRNYVRSVSLIVIDEIHLLGEDRGPVLEVIVSRTNYIISQSDFPLRIIGLSTALANARDLADWLRIGEDGLFNFRPSVRPVPLEVHIEGFPGKHYCPRMATMNKPTFQAIVTHSPEKPVLVFVSSRRQTRLTALDLIAYLAAEDNPKQWLHLAENEMDNIIAGIKDTNLKLTLAFGIGIHHAGLQEKDRRMVEELFVSRKIQVLVATATLAWGVNFPAHLVVVKGTEYYDGKTRRYVDFPITDVLQMMGRAGRPQYDEQGIAVVLVHDVKKNFYKKFLYSPFPVESSLLDVLPEHLNAEIVAGTITSIQDSLDYLTWTYFFRRLIQNPSYYLLEDVGHESLTKFLSGLVEGAMKTLTQSSCIEIGDDNRSIISSTLGRIASYYYLHHSTVKIFHEKIAADSSHEQLLDALCSVYEYNELPVRHNEDAINSELAKHCPLEVNPYTFDSPHTKANLLFQAHFSRLQLPCTDYLTDLKSVLDQAIRILQAMLDVSADQGFLATAIRVTSLIQMVLQARWYKECSLLILPGVESEHLHLFRDVGRTNKNRKPNTITCLPELVHVMSKSGFETLARMLRQEFDESQIENIYQILCTLPWLKVKVSVKGWWESSSEKEEVPVILGGKEDNVISLHADQEYVLNVSLARYSKLKKQDSHAYAPRFPKPKDEGWFVILGDVANNELLALKRVNYVQRQNVCQLMFYTPPTTGRVTYTLFVLSDSYLGMDQQYDVRFDVIPVSLEAQVNTEVTLNRDEAS